jgi:hypothetical protein
VKTIATAIAALSLSASPAVLAQPTGSYDQPQSYPQGNPAQGNQDQGYQGYGRQSGGYQAPQGPSQSYPAPDQGSQSYQAQGQGQGYQGPGYPPSNGAPPASGQAPYAGEGNQQQAQQYDRSEDSYEQQMRDYQRERREYDRQRAAYDAQFGGGAAAAYGPPPPPPPPPPPGPASWRGGGSGYYRYGDTIPFRDGPWNGGDRGPGWYRDHGCRLAVPRDDPYATSGRFIPVCPDDQGNYRPA